MLLPVFPRGHSEVSAEDLREIALVVEADFQGNLEQTFVGVTQQLDGAVDTQLVQQVVEAPADLSADLTKQAIPAGTVEVSPYGVKVLKYGVSA